MPRGGRGALLADARAGCLVVVQEVLCLHEMEGLLKYLTDDDFTKVPSTLTARCRRDDRSACRLVR